VTPNQCPSASTLSVRIAFTSMSFAYKSTPTALPENLCAIIGQRRQHPRNT
jgi:hypothetical protein